MTNGFLINVRLNILAFPHILGNPFSSAAAPFRISLYKRNFSPSCFNSVWLRWDSSIPPRSRKTYKMRGKFYETNASPIQSDFYFQTESVQEPNKFGCSKGQVFDSENQQCKGQLACMWTYSLCSFVSSGAFCKGEFPEANSHSFMVQIRVSLHIIGKTHFLWQNVIFFLVKSFLYWKKYLKRYDSLFIYWYHLVWKFLFLVEDNRKGLTFSFLRSLYHWCKIVFQNTEVAVFAYILIPLSLIIKYCLG